MTELLLHQDLSLQEQPAGLLDRIDLVRLFLSRQVAVQHKNALVRFSPPVLHRSAWHPAHRAPFMLTLMKSILH